MGTSNKYWTATEKAHVDQSDVKANWGQPGVAYSVVAVDALNYAFEIFYSAKTNITSCSDASQRAGMLAELHDCAYTGWGIGVWDLDDAFEHLIANNGSWTDSNTKNYYGGPNKIYKPANMILSTAACAANFLGAVDDHMAKLREAMVDYNTSRGNAESAAAASDWAKASKAFGNIKSYGGKAKYLLWWAPTAQNVVGKASSFAGILGDFTSAVDTYDNCVRSGIPSDASAALAAMQAAMKFVPVFGGMYGQIISKIPTLVDWYKGLQEDYFRRVDAAAAGR